MKNKKISIIVPAYNEEKNLPSLLPRINKLRSLFPLEVIVAEGGSKDKTVTVAQKFKADKVLSFGKKRGKGTDFWAAVKEASGDYIIQIDADGQFQPEEIPDMIEKLDRGNDVVLGTRFKKGAKVEKEAVSRIYRLGHFFLSLITSLAAKKRITDVMAGFKGFKKEALLPLSLKTSHFGYEAEVIIKSGQRKFKIAEIPITYKKRIVGKSNINTIKDGLLVLETIIKTFFGII